MAKQLELDGRTFWILSQPMGSRWQAAVVELIDAARSETEPIGIEAIAETRGAADDAAERKLRRLLQLPSS